MSISHANKLIQRAIKAGHSVRISHAYADKIGLSNVTADTRIGPSTTIDSADVDDIIEGYAAAAKHPAIKNGLRELLKADFATKASFIGSCHFDLTKIVPLRAECTWEEICEQVCSCVMKTVCEKVCEPAGDGKEVCKTVCGKVCEEVCKEICHRVCVNSDKGC